MNKRFRSSLSLLALSLCCGNLLAGSVEVPNTFVSGTTASASEVNANFNAVKTAVDDNDSRITANAGDISANAANIAANTNAIGSNGIGVFVNGARIGSLLYYPARAFTEFPILLPSNYVARVNTDGTGLSNQFNGYLVIEPFFVSNDCTGQAFFEATALDQFVKFGQGQVFRSLDSDPVAYRYVEAGTSVETLAYNSKNIGANCQTVSGTIEAYKSFPNDPDVTGVTGTEFIGAITIAH